MKENYSWSDMANFMTDCGIPHELMSKLADVQMSILMKRPIFNIFKFDDYLHDIYGDYEGAGKSMADIFSEIFGEKMEEAKFYFGISI